MREKRMQLLTKNCDFMFGRCKNRKPLGKADDLFKGCFWNSER